MTLPGSIFSSVREGAPCAVSWQAHSLSLPSLSLESFQLLRQSASSLLPVVHGAYLCSFV